jgi:hypothetical protein
VVFLLMLFNLLGLTFVLSWAATLFDYIKIQKKSFKNHLYNCITVY